MRVCFFPKLMTADSSHTLIENTLVLRAQAPAETSQTERNVKKLFFLQLLLSNVMAKTPNRSVAQGNIA